MISSASTPTIGEDVEVSFTLHPANGGGIVYEERELAAVPRIGEIVGFEYDAYQVVDVLWHLTEGAEPQVTITAVEKNWHKRIADVTARA